MQRIGESRWRPLELCYWPDQGALPAKGKEYPGLGYKRLRDKPPKAQQQQPAEAQSCQLYTIALRSGSNVGGRRLMCHVHWVYSTQPNNTWLLVGTTDPAQMEALVRDKGVESATIKLNERSQCSGYGGRQHPLANTTGPLANTLAAHSFTRSLPTPVALPNHTAPKHIAPPRGVYRPSAHTRTGYQRIIRPVLQVTYSNRGLRIACRSSSTNTLLPRSIAIGLWHASNLPCARIPESLAPSFNSLALYLQSLSSTDADDH
ncbi:hypothetical protein HaLaN_31964, partial [Haematococcus lacustris]